MMRPLSTSLNCQIQELQFSNIGYHLVNSFIPILKMQLITSYLIGLAVLTLSSTALPIDPSQPTGVPVSQPNGPPPPAAQPNSPPPPATQPNSPPPPATLPNSPPPSIPKPNVVPIGQLPALSTKQIQTKQLSNGIKANLGVKQMKQASLQKLSAAESTKGDNPNFQAAKAELMNHIDQGITVRPSLHI